MGTRLAMVITIVFCLLFTLSCNSGAKPQTQEPDLLPQIQSEASEFQKLLDKLVSCQTSIVYPHSITISDIFPDGWFYEKLETPGTTNIEMCAVAVPIPEGINEGLYETKFEEEKELITLTTDHLTPPTNLYIVSLFRANPHGGVMGVPADFLSFPKKIEHTYFQRHIVVESPYYVPHNGTHGIYMMEGMGTFRDDGVNYELANIINDIQKASPYLETSTAGATGSGKMWQLIAQLRAQIDIIREDADNALKYINDMGVYLYRPDELASSQGVGDYKAHIKSVNSTLDELDACIAEIENWDFTNLEQYRSSSTGEDQQ